MLVVGVVSIVDDGWYGWLMIAGALLMVASLVQLARERRKDNQ
jgi:hypothetical protein